MAEDLRPLDSSWLRAHPLPAPDNDTDKNGRGRVLAIGGCRVVPGGIQLTVEAALRAGAGKIQVATIESAALALGIAMPEVAVFGLPETPAGELWLDRAEPLTDLLGRCDAVVAGPAMTDRGCGSNLSRLLAEHCEAQLVLDAGVLMGLADHEAAYRLLARPAILTPHAGELAALLDCDAAAIEADRASAVREASARFGAICVLKGPNSLIAAPGALPFPTRAAALG